jgi:hypothetical protein
MVYLFFPRFELGIVLRNRLKPNRLVNNIADGNFPFIIQVAIDING